ncbi:ROK family protein [Sinorhizobium americanum]|uniref:Glucokinase n=1 Tax=Sinorhizobium americanum TaxID=194963 RepID=A0A1L3LU48_9HYPH|nr:ROK family protein [Sinorhizobium americanum]APG87105.1 glucokinase [Sinorhizobium americanum CCGM7]APG93619.1 glucokinase [Sinorhizobium americanum]OAP44057.1 ROK family transcriptional regulator [Sinorhizobium americanum]
MDLLIRRLRQQDLSEHGTAPGDRDRTGSAGLVEGGQNTHRLIPAQSLISAGTLGPANRGRLLQALYDMGPSSRADLARFTGVSRGTIGGIVQPLLDQRILAEGEAIPPNQAGGKPATKLWFSKEAKPICAVLLMHDRVHTCLVSLEGEINAENVAEVPQALTGASDVFQIVSGCVERTITSSSYPILGIGAAVAGMIDTETGSILRTGPVPYLDGFPIRAELTKKFGVPVVVDQDTRALIVGDRWFGQGRGRRNFAVVYIGETLRGALFLNGHVHRGAAGAGGEIGHTIVQLNGRACHCGRRGCWETVATLKWIREKARSKGLPQPHALNAGRLVMLANQGVKEAVDLLDEYAFNVSVGLANLQHLIAPNCIILHGDVVHGGRRMLDLIERSFRDQLLDRPGDEIRLALGDSENVAALRGAAGLILSELLNFVI